MNQAPDPTWTAGARAVIEFVMATGSQLRMFEPAEPRTDLSFTGARRVQLDDQSWVEHVPAWLSGHQALLDQLLALPQWEQRERWMFTRKVQEPRLTAEYPVLSETPIDMLRLIGQALSDRYGVVYDGLWLNLYRDQHDSTSWHGDQSSCQRDLCIVPVLSLGARRSFLIRPREGGPSTVFKPESGDLIVMGGRCQRDWLHAVPKQARPAGPRVSVNFKSDLQATPSK